MIQSICLDIREFILTDLRYYSRWNAWYDIQMMQTENKIEYMNVLKWSGQNWGMTQRNTQQPVENNPKNY